MNVPAHIAIIMDGNGRWAKEKGMVRLKGHQAGMESLREIVRACSDKGVKVLTVYAFSTENWKRPIEEVSGIFSLLVRYVAKELKELNANNVQIRMLGDIDPLPADAKKAAQKAVDSTKDNTGLIFCIAINYGGRAEIVRAVNRMIADGITEADEETVSRYLSEELDKTDPIPQNYYLMVSSPGMDRQLYEQKDYDRFTGEVVDVRLYKSFEGSKEYQGTLLGLTGGEVIIRTEDNRELKFPLEQVSKTCLAVIF